MAISAANVLGLDYRAEAARLGPPVVPIIDAHAHIHGRIAAPIYNDVRRLFGITRTYSMTQLPMAPIVRDLMGDSVRFITMPTFVAGEREVNHQHGYLRTIEAYHHDYGARMMKIWASPRLRELIPGAVDLFDIDSHWRREHCKLATSLGMMIMVHVADPDTWFSTKYADGSVYGTKAHQYVGLRRMLDLFPVPWIAAHMGGWPEDLGILDTLLESHPNLHIDSSATKWVIRELGKHDRDDVLAFFWKWKGRILFGSDIVTVDDQTSTTKTGASGMGDLANSPDEAWELYASRYWALRTMFETEHNGQSPIADPDLARIDPQTYNAMSVPPLRGLSFPNDLLTSLYRDAAEGLVERWWREHP